MEPKAISIISVNTPPDATSPSNTPPDATSPRNTPPDATSPGNTPPDATVYENLAFSSESVEEGKINIELTDSPQNGSIDNKSVPIAEGNTDDKDNTDHAGNTDHMPHAHSHVDFTVPSSRKHADRSSRYSISDTGPYRGMGKEELLRYSSRPFWRNLRYVCMSVVLTGWLALLITVVALVLTYPQCRRAQEQDWWQKAVVYRVYVRSFLDAQNEDGIGDINGTRMKLDYIQSTGANTISLSPFYKLAQWAPTDTHIVDHMEVNETMGTLEDIQLLINETHARGMHVTVDFIPNHTSDEHPWFVQSRADGSRDNEYRSYYVWAESENGQPINNWQSVYNSTAWRRNDTSCSDIDNRTTCSDMYLAQFMSSQPDLNLRSDKVKDELMKILEFWLDMGVDGFYIRDADFLFEDYDLRDENGKDNVSYTRGETQNLDLLAHWRAALDDYGNKTGRYRILLADVDGPRDHVMDYYGLFSRDGADFPLNTDSMKLEASRGGRGLAEVITGWMDHMPAGRWPNWMSGDDRNPRLVDRLGEDLAKAYMLVMMLLPGTPFVYYGDEIGMRDVYVPPDTPIYSRMKSMRAPMLWDNMPHTHHGFCHEQQHCRGPWLNFNQSLGKDTNRDAESQHSEPDSMLNLFKNLTSLRNGNPSFLYGDYNVAVNEGNIFSFVRDFDGETGYLVAVNFDRSAAQTRYFKGSHHTVPGAGTVEVIAGDSFRRGQSIGLDPLTLGPAEGVVVSWDYEAKEL